MAKLIALYNADGGFFGELRYIWDKINGRADCALCAITHGTNPRGKKEWHDVVKNLPVPLKCLHRNNMPAHIAQLMQSHPLPAIVLLHPEPQIFITRQQLIDCQSSPAQLAALIRQQLAVVTG